MTKTYSIELNSRGVIYITYKSLEGRNKFAVTKREYDCIEGEFKNRFKIADFHISFDELEDFIKDLQSFKESVDELTNNKNEKS